MTAEQHVALVRSIRTNRGVGVEAKRVAHAVQSHRPCVKAHTGRAVQEYDGVTRRRTCACVLHARVAVRLRGESKWRTPKV
eukprot:scaffold29565_cov17-Tisochrysis_lutea.AAC.1